MMLLAVCSWWFGAGWAAAAHRAGQRIDRVFETFSVDMLLKSLFEPFKQIDAGRPRGGSFEAQLRAFGDRLFSRLFGAAVRSMFIIIGLLVVLFVSILEGARLVLWPFVPFLPIIGAIFALLGWMP